MAELHCPLSLVAQNHGDRPALLDRETKLTWSQVASAVDNLTEHLSKSGLKKGDRAAIVENNRIELPILLLALFRIGSVAILFSPRYPETSLAEMAIRCNCRYNLFWSHQSPEPLFSGEVPIHLPSLSALRQADDPEAARPFSSSIDSDQPATIVHTSGSTATPKAALLSYGNLHYNALGSNANLPVRAGDRWLLSLPLYHVGGLGVLFRCLLGGGTAVIADTQVSLGEQIGRDQITHVSMVPTQLRRFLDDPHRKNATATLKAVLLGGASAPPSLLDDAAASDLPVYLSYGLTEMASQVATGSPLNPTALKVLPHREVQIADDGEILVRGETLFTGYVEGDSTVRPFDSEGWFRTGDLGSLDAHGNLSVAGRKDNMFISGGENIQPEQIEQALTAINGIYDALVVPVEEREYAHRPVAFVRYDERINLSDPESTIAESERLGFDYISLVDELARTLPRFMIPVAIYPWPHQHELTGMKADRQFLRKLAEKLHRAKK